MGRELQIGLPERKGALEGHKVRKACPSHGDTFLGAAYWKVTTCINEGNLKTPAGPWKTC